MDMEYVEITGEKGEEGNSFDYVGSASPRKKFLSQATDCHNYYL